MKQKFISKTKIKMTVTKNLHSSFERTRITHAEKLEYLLSIGVHPDCVEKLAFMFAEIGATMKEITSQEDSILSLSNKIYGLDIKKQRLHRKEVVDYSNIG